MIVKSQQGIHWLEFELLQSYSGVSHAVLSRRGGLNLSRSSPEHFAAVQKIFPAKQWPSLRAVHGHRVVRVGREQPSGDYDGFVTNELGCALLVTHADCQAAIFYDPVKRALGAVHAGWRGLVQGIYSDCIGLMRQEFSCNPADVIVTISPSLGPSHSEFIHYKQEIPEKFYPFKEGQCHFNLWQMAQFELCESGVLPEHIQIAGLCSYEQEGDFFSYRRDKTTARNATIALLVDTEHESHSG